MAVNFNCFLIKKKKKCNRSCYFVATATLFLLYQQTISITMYM